MALTLTQADYNEVYFNGGGDIGGYTNYSGTSQYSIDACNLLITKFLANSGLTPADLVGRKVLVIGCAYGYLVKYLISMYSVDAYGFDWSTYAISQAPPEVASRVFVGDARVESNYTTAKTMAGLTKPNDKFELIIDEDMLACLSDANAITVRNLMLKYANMVYHLVDSSSNLINWYNYKTITEWKALVGNSPKEKWYTRFYGSET